MKLTNISSCVIISAIAATLPMTSASAQVKSTPDSSHVDQAVDIDDDAPIEDIVVTANRREERLQDVPIAINVLTAEAARLQGVTGTTSLQTQVPSLSIARAASAAQPFLRGIGSSSGNPNAEPSVAIYVDGVYNPTPMANFFEFNNIERIEVLKGPQGTQFGRNATGGVIQIITKDPGGTPEGEIRLGYANYDTVSMNGYLSAPITETIGANIAVLYSDQRNGWGKNIFTGRDTVGERSFGSRAKFVWSPSSTTTIRLSADYNYSRDGAINGQNPPGTTNLNIPVITDDLLRGGPGRGEPFPGKYNTNNNFEQRAELRSGGASLKIAQDLSGLQLMSLSAYREVSGYWRLDQDLSGFPFLNAQLNQNTRMYSQELHILSPKSSKLSWIAGVYYFDFLAGVAPTQLTGVLFDSLFGIPGVDQYSRTKTQSLSAFVQGTYPITANTNVTLGFRYTWEKVRYEGTTTFLDSNIPVPGIGGPVRAEAKDQAPTFRISIDHKITPDIMMYASFNRGRKSGGHEVGLFNQAAAQDASFDAEKVDAYELGVKSSFLNERVRFNVAGFLYDFTNMQFQKIVSGSGFTFNAPNGAKIYGIEADFDARLTENLKVNGSIGYLHSKLRDFEGAPNTCLDTATGRNDSGGFFCNGLNGLPDPGNLIPYNAKGNRTPNSPELTMNFGAIYTLPTSVGKFTFAGNAYYTSRSYFEIDNRTSNPSRWLLSGSLGWSDSNDRFSVTLWGRNLTGEYYYNQRTGQGGASDIASPAAPRQYGIILGYRF